MGIVPTQPLKKEYRQFFFAKGINTKVEQSALPLGSLHLLDNAKVDKFGVIQKRPGMVAMPTTVRFKNSASVSTLPAIRKFLTINDAIYAVGLNAHTGNPTLTSDDRMYGYEESLGWTDLGKASSVIMESHIAGAKNSYTYSGNPQSIDMAVGGNKICIIKEEETTPLVTISLLDANTYECITTTTATGFAPRVIWIPSLSSFYCTYTSGGNIKAIKIDATAGTIGAASNFITTAYGLGPLYDICLQTLAGVDNIYVAFQNTTPQIQVLRLNTALAVVNSVLLTGGLPTTNISIFLSGTDVCVCTGGVANTYLASVTSACVLIQDFFVAYAGTSDRVAGSNLVINTRNAIYLSSSTGTIRVIYWVHTGTTVTVQSLAAENYSLASKPFAYLGADHIFVIYTAPGSLQTSLVLWMVDGNQFAGPYIFSPLGRMFYGELYQVSTVGGYYGTIPQVVVDPNDSSKFLTAQLHQTETLTTAGSGTYATVIPKIVTADFDNPLGYQQRPIDGETFYTGGVLREFDGLTETDNGFPFFPEKPRNLVSSNGAGTLTNNGVYSYCFVIEWTNAKGKITQSSPSLPTSITLGAADDTVTFGTQNVSWVYAAHSKDVASTMTVKIYRTINGGTTYFLVQAVSNSALTAGTVVDGASDAAISVNEILYTAGGVLPNDAVGPARAVTVWKNRVWVIADNEIRYSKVITPGQPVNFSEFFVLPLEPVLGRLTGIAALLDKFIIFTKQKIYYITGDGPNDAGGGNLFPLPQLIESTCGCLSQTSIIELGASLMFQGDTQYWTLTAGLQVSPVGQELDHFLTESTVVNCAGFVNRNSEVWIQTSTDLFVYNTNTQVWSRSTGLMAGTSFANFRGSPCVISNGLPYIEDSNNYFDGTSATPVTLRVKTGWINLGEIEGFQRLRKAFILGRYYSDHTLNVRVFYDYLPRVAETFTIPAYGVLNVSSITNLALFTDAQVYEASNYSVAGGQPYCVMIKPKQQKCMAVRFEIYDTAQAVSENGLNNYRSLDLISIGLELAMKDTSPKVPKARVMIGT